jgi:hypothetical protein
MQTESTYCRIAALALLLGLSLGSALAGVSPAVPSPVAPSATSFPWPLQFAAGAESAVIYPPELDSVGDTSVAGTFAVAVRAGDDAQPRFGIVRFQARVQLDPSDPAAATVNEFRASQLDFPSEPERAAELLGQIQAALSGAAWHTTRWRLQESLSVAREHNRARSVPLRNEAPRILFSERPAVLVSVDGAPALREVQGSNLQRVVNTRALILIEPASGRYYLRLLGNWFAAERIDGPWGLSPIVPSEVGRVKDELARTDLVDLLEPSGDSDEAEAAPVPVVSTVPTELIITQGPAQWGAIKDTQLLYITNSTSSVFYDLRGRAYYVALSGRWYRSAAFPSSEWQYVAADRLPADFARVPEGHPMGAVRASVAGTPEADEAQIAMAVPQTAVVQRSSAKLDLAYDGPPRFGPIGGTSLEWAVNANIPVIRVSDYAYYALQNGVWFSSITGTSGWKVADWVPPEIYSIPPSSPLHYVTYVRVYEATPSDVYVGYTPGYLGWYDGGTGVVYGTGWGYQPWIGGAWYPWPWTWGCGCCSAWWGPWFGFGFYYGGWWAYPWPVYAPHVHRHAHWWHHHAPAFIPRVAGVGARAAPVPGRVPAIIVNGDGNKAGVHNVYGNWGARLPVTPTSPALSSLHAVALPAARAAISSGAPANSLLSARPQLAWARPSGAPRTGGVPGWSSSNPRPGFPAATWAPSVHPAPPVAGGLYGAMRPRPARVPQSVSPAGAFSTAPAPVVRGPAPAPAFYPAAPTHPMEHATAGGGAQPHAPAGGARGGGRGRR